MKRIPYILLLLAWAFPLPVRAQHPCDSLLARGDSLHRTWRFSEAGECYRQAAEAFLADSLLTASGDSLLLKEAGTREILARNGASMANYVSRPGVIARARHSRDDFFLYYPLPDSSWKEKPGFPDYSAPSPLAPATLRPWKKDAPWCYSVPDETGHYRIWLRYDGEEATLVPGLPEDSDALLPVLSPDGSEIRFSAKGLPGVGGYDLYSIRWNPRKRDWDAPVNMGFPYSSPGNDYLYIAAPDGQYSAFASDRACPGADSLDVYILEYELTPVYSAVDSPEELADICRLDPPVKHSDAPSAAGDNGTSRYMASMSEVRQLRDTLSRHIKQTEQLRSRFSATPDSLRHDIQNLILQAERDEASIRARIDRLSAELSRIESEFLQGGLFLPVEEPSQKEPARPEFVWQRHCPQRPFTERERRIIERSDSVMYVTVLPEDSLILRSISRDLSADELASPLLRTLLDKMVATVTSPQQGGVGIAAPQVGLNRRIVLVQRFDKPGEPFEAYVNIHIDSLSGPLRSGPEGCLSVPGKRGMVQRHSLVTISYLDGATLTPRTETIDGYTAIIFQHECDHLDGILYIDRTKIVVDNPDWESERAQYDYSKPDWW